MRVFVTGDTGAVGGYAVPALVRAGCDYLLPGLLLAAAAARCDIQMTSKTGK